MNSLDFYQVECPKCHSPLNSIDPLSGKVKCPFCGTNYQITANMKSETGMSEQIVPFATLVGDFVYSACKMLAEADYAPVDISGLISFDGIKGVYLPVFFYEGQYECDWSCKIKQTPANDGAEKTRKEVYRQENGVSKGDYFVVGLACEGVESGRELAEYVRAMDYRGDGLKPFQRNDLNNCLFLVRNMDASQTWRQWGEESLNTIARNNTCLHLQSNDIKDFKCKVVPKALHEGRFIFYPVWMLNYQYDGKLHHIFMDGTGRNGVKGTTLIDRSLKAKAEKPFTILKYIAVVAIVIPLLMLLAGWYLPACIALVATGLVFFAYRYYAQWHKNRLIRKARDQREKIVIHS